MKEFVFSDTLMFTNRAKNPQVSAERHRLEMNMVSFTADQRKLERALMVLRAESRSLDKEKKRVILEIEQNSALLRKEEVNLQRLLAEISSLKKKMNLLK